MNGEEFIGQLQVKVKQEKVDLIDRKILYLLSCNARLSNTTIAKHLKIGREVVAYRIKRMQELKIIHGYLTLINVQKVGLCSKGVGLKVNTTVKVDDVVNDIKTIPEISSVFQCGGMHDIILTIMAKDEHTCYDVFHNLLLRHGDKIKNYNILTRLEQRFMRLKMLVDEKKDRDYLNKIKERKGSAFQKEFDMQNISREMIKIDHTDKVILDELKLNARIPLTDLSKKTGISVFQLQNRIRKLIKEDVIHGFICYAALAHLGLQFNFVFLNVKQGVETAFKTWTEQHPHIVWCTKYLGDYNYKLSFFVKHNAHLSDILQELCQQFGEGISHIESLPVFRNPQYVSYVK